MLCPHCRRRIQAAPYCCYCGQPTGAAERPVTRRRKRSNGRAVTSYYGWRLAELPHEPSETDKSYDNAL